MKFSDFNFSPPINDAIEQLGFKQPTPIQEKIIPLIQAGENVVGQSQTGSGKSHAFLLPLIDQLKNKEETQLVITAPSRELAEQLYHTASDITRAFDWEIRIERAYGGIDSKQQEEKLQTIIPQIVIGTPGRLLALGERRLIDLYHVTHFVVDEADMTLDMGFLGTVDQIAGQMPDDLHMYVFSATVPDKLKPFLTKYMAHPEWVVIDSGQQISENVENILMPVRGRDRKELLYEVLTLGQPYLAIIFANTKETVDELYTFLHGKGLSVTKIHGDLSARERKRVMRQINHLDFQYVVASDLASRGLDIDGVSDVINYEIPNEIEFFIHRVGRTGRRGLSGRSVTFYHPDEWPAVEYLMNKGLIFDIKDIRGGRWVKAQDPNARQARKKQHSDADDPKIRAMINQNKKKKVKPGYKKKLQENIKSYKQKQRRQKRRRR